MSLINLKYIGLLLMLLDHIGLIFPASPSWFRLLGRLSAPIFFFAFAEAYRHTSDRDKYFKRLFTFAGITSLINYLIITFTEATYISSPLMANIFLTLSLCFIFLKTIDKVKERKLLTQRLNLLVLLLIEFSLFPLVEYSHLALFSVLTFYYLKNKKLLLTITYIIGSLTICILTRNYAQLLMISSVALLTEYNGTYSNEPCKNKYFFYIFYLSNMPMLLLIKELTHFIGF